jgi:guanyl-specific ribonuclease Sa
MQKNYTQFFLGIIIGLVLGLFIGKHFFVTNQPANININSPATEQQTPPKENNGAINSHDKDNSVVIPQKVYDVLKYIQTNHQPMDGYVGGRIFSNREKILPQESEDGNSIRYQEWDVNPKVQGQNRGTERIVTGSDGRAWYTHNHYQSFTQIK